MYICLEGIDGSGKSTQIKMLKEWFATIGQQVFMVKEPTESDIGKLLRNMLESTRATEDN
ncbi:MAG TPA: thymidylate kinase, partial [Methanobacterium sp.]|nr:thymidylate kinase [Methanobacterium sp.]